MRWDALIQKHRKITNIVGTIVVAWLLSAMAAEFIALLLPESAPASPIASARASIRPNRSVFGAGTIEKLSSYMPICERNIFDSEKRSPCTEEVLPDEVLDEPKGDLTSPPVLSDLPVELLGTMVFPTNKSKSFSTIASKKGEDTENYYNGDKILGEAKIYEIERNRVYFIRAGRREYIEVANLPKWSTPPSNNAASEDSTLGIEVQGDKVVISRAKVDASLSDLNKVIQQARMVPNFKDGKVNGFKIFAIRNGSIFQELTIKNGDIIHQINGNEVNSVEKALPLLSLLRDEQEISIDITRRGRSQTLKYEIR